MRKISTGSSLSVPGTSTRPAQTTWTHRVRKPPRPRVWPHSAQPHPASQLCTRGACVPPAGPGSDAGSLGSLPSSSGTAARQSPPENRSPLRLLCDLRLSVTPNSPRVPYCECHARLMHRRHQGSDTALAVDRPRLRRWARCGRTRARNTQGGRAQSSWATSRHQPTSARPPRLEAEGRSLSPGLATCYLGGSLLSLNLPILKKRNELKGLKREGEGDGEGEQEEEQASE